MGRYDSMGRGPKWTPEEELILKDEVEAGKSAKEISRKFHQIHNFTPNIKPRSVEAVRKQMQKIKGTKKKSENEPAKARQRWTADDDLKLVELYRDTTLEIEYIGQHLGRTESAIRSRIHTLGILHFREKQGILTRILNKIRRISSAIP